MCRYTKVEQHGVGVEVVDEADPDEVGRCRLTPG